MTDLRVMFYFVVVVVFCLFVCCLELLLLSSQCLIFGILENRGLVNSCIGSYFQSIYTRISPLSKFVEAKSENISFFVTYTVINLFNFMSS